MMKLINLFLTLASSFSSVGFAAQGSLPLSHDRVVFYENHLQKGKGPHFVFLPGIYRGLNSEDEFGKALIKAKVSFLFFHFAEQPYSVAKTPSSRNPDFSKITSADLAAEMDSLVEHLKIKGSVIPVTLSYSATVTASLDVEKYPVVIEASPLGLDTDTLPPGWVQMMKTWEEMLKWNPFASAWIESAKATQLRNHWTPWVEAYAEDLPQLKDPEYKERALQGYISLTKASEGFDLRNQDFAKGPKRYFILGADEESLRSGIQTEAIELYQKQTGHQKNVIVIPAAGHIVMSDQPEAFLKALKKITAQ